VEEVEHSRAMRRRWPRVLLALLLLLLVALAVLWLARKPIASGYVDRFLAEKGVQARYEVADLGLGRQRLVNVVLGDPRDPDLVADWLEARTLVGLNGAQLTGVRGGRVRLRARLVDGRLSFGSIDRLLPPPSGKAFALPALDVNVADARVRLETPYGVAGLRVSGAGRLDGGFDGRVAVVSQRLNASCSVERAQGVVRVRSRAPYGLARVPTVQLTGPVGFAQGECAGVQVAGARADADVELALGERLGWNADLRLTTGAVRHAQGSAARIAGRVEIAGGPKITGSVALTASDARGANMRAGRLALDGSIVRDTGRQVAFGYDGSVAVADADVRGVTPTLATAGVANTPLAPLAQALASAVGRAAGRLSGEARLNVATGPLGTNLSVATAALRSASGARATLGGGRGLRWSEREGLLLEGSIDVAGGGLPTLTARVAEQSGGRRFNVTMAPYAAGGARLAVTPVTVTTGRDALSVRTVATLSGPFADGRVDGLTVPIDLVQRGRRVVLNRTCTPVAWQRLAVSGLVLDRNTVRLCPTGGALLAVAGGRVGGGATLGATRLTGRLGSTPLALTAARARLRLDDRRFALNGVQARLGQGARTTRIDVATLEGGAGPQGIVGRFAGAGGQVGAVPLLMSDAVGDWRFTSGALSLTGGLTVSDAQTERPRLRPLPVRDVALTLRGPLIEATGRVLAPTDGRLVTTLRLTHNLTRGAGGVALNVPGLGFDKRLQPDQLTPVTFGVIADVKGTVTGEGQISWTPEGVASSGVFRTQGADLAAAFGPVEGIAGEIRFTDLLALQSAPGQTLRVRSVNPGIPVTDGVVRLQTLANARVQVEGARWPFAGGTLRLEPTLLDFSAEARRRLTFRVEGMAADQFLQQFDFKNLDATGTFDGVLPMVFDASGGRIADGRLTVRPGGGTIAYVGDITQKDIGFWPNLAFQALKSLRYRSLNIVMNGPLAGEMVTEVRFAGISQGAGAARGGITGLLVGRLQRLPFVFNIRIKAPFRGLLDATASFYDPSRLIQRNLPRLLEEQEKRRAPAAPPAPPPSMPVPSRSPATPAPSPSPAKVGPQLP
jgi:hypothetical protein